MVENDQTIRFDNQVILITGAGRGLGAAYARLIASRGGTVIVHDAGVNRDGTGGDPMPATNIVEMIKKEGGKAEAQFQNLETREMCEDLVSSVLERHGKIDAFIHSAGIVRYHGIVDTSVEDWERMLNINVSAAWWLSRAIWPSMVQNQYGRILFTVSGFATQVIPGADVSAYSVGKGAQFGMMNALASEGVEHGIAVNAIAPVAATRIFRKKVEPDELTSESIAPGAALFASAQCPGTGKVLVAQGGEFAIDTMSRSKTVNLGSSSRPEDVLEALT